MKLITNGEMIAVTGIPTIGGGTVRIPLEAAPADIGETVQLMSDDGMLLREDTVADYLRYYMDGTTLVLTNTPVPDPVVPEEDPEPDALTQTQLALAELAETEAAHDLENKLALAELAEMMGGTSNG